jgi:hypothetical protein
MMIIIMIIIIIIINADCQQYDETAEHIISACPIVAKQQYTKRHNSVCAYYTPTYARKWG